MDRYRNRTTGEIKTQRELKQENTNMSLPKIWNEFVYDALNVDPVLPSSLPTVGEFQTAVLTGVEQNDNGDWVDVYQVVDMFADDDELGTKAEQEAAHTASLNEAEANRCRNFRNQLLQETDWWAVADRTMTSEQTAYRAALRNLPTHSNWPHLEDSDWPNKPS
jgi:hypothetical protein